MRSLLGNENYGLVTERETDERNGYFYERRTRPL